MTGRAFQRIPYVVKVEFRTPSSFLVAYSINLSRGGIFLETEHPAAIGDSIALEFAVPGLWPIQVIRARERSNRRRRRAVVTPIE